MGILDDAIREHLELKRRRGADPSEVAREETEALGPVRRGEIDLPDRGGGIATATAAEPEAEAERGPAGTQDPYEDEPLAYEDEPAAYEDEPALEAPIAEAPPRPPHEHAYPEGEQAGTPPHGDPLGEAALGHHEHAPGEQPEEGPHAGTPPHGDPLSQPTREFSAGELGEAVGAPSAGDPDVVPADEEEDVLEETPEFLQETPEHDRLWFEQKPPKDFDF